MKARNIRIIISLTLVIGAIVLLVVTTTSRTGYTTHYYHTPTEFLATADSYVGLNVRVNGKVVPGTIQRQEVSAGRTTRARFLAGRLAQRARSRAVHRYRDTRCVPRDGRRGR